MDGQLGDQGLPRPGRGGDDDRLPFQDGEDGPDLEVVKGKGVAALEGPEEVQVRQPEPAGVEGLLDRDRVGLGQPGMITSPPRYHPVGGLSRGKQGTDGLTPLRGFPRLAA